MNKLKSISLPRTYTQFLQWVTYVWAGTICFPQLQGSFYAVFAVLLYGVVRGHLGFSFTNRLSDGLSLSKSDFSKNERNSIEASFWKSRKTPFYFLLAYLLWMTVTIFWSDDIREYFRQFEKLIPLYLLAFIGFTDSIDKHININKVLNAFLWGVVICIGYMVVRMGVDMFVGDTIGRIKTAGIMSLDILSYVNHRTYIGCTLLMAVPMLLMHAKAQGGWQRFASIAFVLFIDLLCVMSSARVLMGLSVLVTAYSVYDLWGRGVRWYVKLLAIFLLIALSTFVISKNQRIQSKFNQIKNDVAVEKVESRTYLWASAWELIQEAPLFGYGMGDAQNELMEVYEEKGYKIALTNELNSHNQYLQMMLFGGILPFGFFLIFLVFIVFVNRSKWITLGMLLVIIVGNLVESMLVRNMGVVLLIFFVLSHCLFANTEFNQAKGVTKLSKPMSVIVLLFLSIAWLSTFLSVCATKPRTYMTEDFQVVDYGDLPQNDQLPRVTDGVRVNSSNIKEFKNTTYMISVIHKEKSISTMHPLLFSLWCYVENSDCYDVYISINDRLFEVKASYDKENAMSWQKLEIITDRDFLMSDLSIVTSYNNDSVSDTGGVYVALPDWKNIK